MKKVVRLFQLEQEIRKAKNQGRLNKALKYYNEILEIKHKISNKLGLAKTYAEKGYLLNECGLKEEAFRSYKKAKEIAINSKNPDFLQIINNQMDLI